MLSEVDPTEYERVWREVHETVFSGRPADERPFRSDGWRMYLIGGGLRVAVEDLDALRSAVRSAGDVESVIIDGDGEWADKPARILQITTEDFEEVHCNTVFGQSTAHIFGRSGRWGLVTHHEGFAVLGCDPELAADFEQRASGIHSVKDRFSKAAPGIGFGDKGRAYVAALRAMVGWAE